MAIIHPVCWIASKHAGPWLKFPAINQLLQFSILGVFPAADKMGETLSGECGLPQGRQGVMCGQQLQIIQGISVYWGL